MADNTNSQAQGNSTLANNNNSQTIDEMRIKYGFWIVLVGLILIGVVFLVAIARWTTAADVTTVVGSLTGVVGTMVGAFFGVQVGSSGKEKAEADRTKAESKAVNLAAALDPKIAKGILSQFN